MNVKITFTTSQKIKCNICKNKLYGKKGFIKISTLTFYGNKAWYGYCLGCFQKILDNIEEDKKTIDEKFIKRLKQRTLQSLK